MPFLANVGMKELLVILVIVALVFGASRLPQLARAMGSSVNEFKKGMKDSDAADPTAKPDETQTK
jgi:sec-independent protein translocase protein TatA